MSEHITLTVEVAGESRAVEFTVAQHGRSAHSDDVFAASISRGGKCHRVHMMAFYQGDGTWRTSKTATALNRPAIIVGWADSVASSAASEHHATAI